MENEIFRESKISKAYIRLSLPLVFSMVVTLIYNLADTYFVAQTNDTNIVAGVSLGMPVFTLLMALGMIIAIVISNYYIYLAIGAPAAMLSFIHSNFLRSEGMSKESMMGTILGAVVNIVLDPFFISILGIGIPAASVNLMQSVSVVLMNQFLLPFGNEKLQQWELS